MISNISFHVTVHLSSRRHIDFRKGVSSLLRSIDVIQELVGDVAILVGGVVSIHSTGRVVAVDLLGACFAESGFGVTEGHVQALEDS